MNIQDLQSELFIEQYDLWIPDSFRPSTLGNDKPFCDLFLGQLV